MKRYLMILPALAIGYCIAWLAFGFVNDRHIASHFESVHADSTEQRVHVLLGKPSKVDASCSSYGTALSTNCDHVLIYRSWFAPLNSSYWLVFIDRTGHAAATSRQVRP